MALRVYRPSTTGNRKEAFPLKDNIAIRGGYAGLGEPDPDARNIEAYETILSGDLNGDAGPYSANNSENSFHVVSGGMYNEKSCPILTNCVFSDNLAYLKEPGQHLGILWHS